MKYVYWSFGGSSGKDAVVRYFIKNSKKVIFYRPRLTMGYTDECDYVLEKFSYRHLSLEDWDMIIPTNFDVLKHIDHTEYKHLIPYRKHNYRHILIDRHKSLRKEGLGRQLNHMLKFEQCVEKLKTLVDYEFFDLSADDIYNKYFGFPKKCSVGSLDDVIPPPPDKEREDEVDGFIETHKEYLRSIYPGIVL